jgi:hypothetical protein
MTTDRPDATETPYTIEPGHVQLEMDFANWSRYSVSGVRATETEFAPFNLRFGIESDLEAGIFVVPYRRESVSVPAAPDFRQYGFGDMTARVKLNLLGNDTGDFAIGAIADVKLPTGSGGLGNGKFEGGLGVPYAFKLAGDWTGAGTTWFNLVYNGAEYRLVWDNTLSFSHALGQDLDGFVEVTSSAGDGHHVATLNFGFSRSVGANMKLDGGVNIGLSHFAPDVRFFAGMARRW